MVRLFLAPLSWFYSMVVTLRHRLFDCGLLKSERFKVPIICIGNITVGGTGKTPMAEMLIDYMSTRYRVALLSRGYGRRTKGYIEVQPDSHYRDVGDEPLQIKMKFPDVTVVVCEKRVEGVRRLMQEHPDVELIIMDDGFQHRHIEPKINIVMIDYTRPVQHDHMLPLGTLRDTVDSLNRAHYFIVTKCPEYLKPIERRIAQKVLVKVAYQQVYFSRLQSDIPHPVFGAEALEPLEPHTDVIALSGIGNPVPFVGTLKSAYNVVENITLGDHHVYRVGDMRRLEELLKNNSGAKIVTTEKDAVKLIRSKKIPAIIRKNLYYMPVKISFIDGLQTEFLQKLEQDVRND